MKKLSREDRDIRVGLTVQLDLMDIRNHGQGYNFRPMPSIWNGALHVYHCVSPTFTYIVLPFNRYNCLIAA